MMDKVIETYLKNVTKEKFLEDIKKADCLHLVTDLKIEKERPAKFKNKYEAMNFVNEKYDVIPHEITCREEANEFWNDLCTLVNMGKIQKLDYDLVSHIMDTY